MVDTPEDEKAALADDAAMVAEAVAMAKELPSVQALPQSPKLDVALADVITMMLALQDDEEDAAVPGH